MVCAYTSTEVILLGDMNYRLEMSNDEYKRFLKKYERNTEERVNYKEMFSKDQLTNQE